MAEAEIVADHDRPRAEALHQNPLHEITRLQIGQAAIETQQQHPVDSRPLQQAQFAAKPGNARRRRLRRKELARRRLEHHHRRWQAKLPRQGQQAPDQGLMTQVQAVEIADRYDAAAVAGRQVVQAADQLHCRRGGV